MSKIARLAGETALYGLGSIVPRALNFFLVMLHSRIFLPEDYGRYTNLYAWVAFLNIIFLFGMETAYFRFATKEGEDEGRVFRVAQTFVLSMSLILSGLIMMFSTPIAEQFHLPGREKIVVWLALVMLVDAAVAVPFARLRLHKKAVAFGIAKIANVGLVIGLNLYFLLIAYDPTIGIGLPVLANLLGNLFFLFFFLRTLTQWRPAWDLKQFGNMFRYAFPIMLTGLAGMTNEMFSRVTLEWWLPTGFYPGKESSAALGIFGACYRFSIIMSVAVQAFRFAAEPFFFSNAPDKRSPQLFARVNHYFVIVCGFIGLAVVVNLDILKYLIGEAYWEGLTIVPVLLAAYLLLGVYYNVSIWFKLTDRTLYGTVISVAGMALTILLNYILIPRFGYMGSSWATFSCYLFMALLCYGLGQRHYPIPYKLLRSSLYILLAFGLGFISSVISIPSPWASLGLHTALIGVYVLVAYFVERRAFKEIGQNL